MQVPVSKFIDLLQAKQLLSDEVVSELRRQVAESKVKLTPEMLARVLVDNGHLTKFQATKLIGELRSGEASLAVSNSSGRTGAATNEDDLLDFAPASDVAEVVLEEEDVVAEVQPLEVIEDAMPVVAAKPPAKNRSSDRPLTDVSAESGAAIEPKPPASSEPQPQPRSRSRRHGSSSTSAAPKPKQHDQNNPWGSNRILGVAVVLGIVCVLGFFLVRWFVRGSAEDALALANKTYEQQMYEDASNMYADFARNWPSNENASYARVRQSLANIRTEVEGGTNPVTGLRKTEELIPNMVAEAAFSQQQSDLAGALVRLASKFGTRIDQTKKTDDRKQLMSEWDKLMSIIEDPKVLGSTQRNQQAPTLQTIEESRARLNREIKRDDELVVALAAMDTAIEAKDVPKAYAIRSDLISQYPQLESNDQLKQRVMQASDLQKALVKDSSQSIGLLPADHTVEIGRPFALTHRTGRSAPELQGVVVYVRAKGTLYAIDGESGELRWRRLIGRGTLYDPVRLGSDPAADVVMVQPEQGWVMRLDSATGQPKWIANFAEAVFNPVFDGSDLLVTCPSGRIACLDPVSGQAKWAKQLPQGASCSAGVMSGKQTIFQAADQTSLYMLDRRDGKCQGVYYAGHRNGAIQVPPVLVQGHLLVPENISASSARLRVYEFAEGGLTAVQTSLPPLEGNVVVPLLIDRRQVLVQSDLGQTLILEVDPSSTSEKISIVAKVPKNLDWPQRTYLALDRNQAWLAENRLQRSDLIVSSGKLTRKWIQHQGDQFVAPLQLFGKTLIHARRLRGNQGVRVTAANAEDGSKLWDLDLAEPVTSLAKVNDKYAAVTSGGNLYQLSDKLILSKADIAAGEGKPEKAFGKAAWLTATQAILPNGANGREFALFSDAEPMLRVLTSTIGAGIPTCDPVPTGNKLLVSLDSGQLMLIDPATGLSVGAPFQPAMQPSSKRVWNQPAYFPDTQTILAANDSGQIYRLSSSELRLLSEEKLESRLIGPLLALGASAAAVQSASGGDELVLINTTSLKIDRRLPLPAARIAGPFALDDQGLVQTQRGLVCFDNSGQMLWQAEFPPSEIVSANVAQGQLIVLSRAGQLVTFELQSGRAVGTIDLKQAPTSSPLLLGKRLLVGTDEGVVLALALPSNGSN